MTIICLISFLVGAPCMLYAFAMFDRLLRWQHDHDPATWEAVGSPMGFFWRPSGATSLLSGSAARSRLFYQWLFAAPDWAHSTPQCARSLFRYRIAASISVVAVLTSFVVFFLDPRNA
jgi:hypothetical protein